MVESMWRAVGCVITGLLPLLLISRRQLVYQISKMEKPLMLLTAEAFVL